MMAVMPATGVQDNPVADLTPVPVLPVGWSFRYRRRHCLRRTCIPLILDIKHCNSLVVPDRVYRCTHSSIKFTFWHNSIRLAK